ncbi:MAG: hypothetical protein LBB09_03025 [Rickettsiales bacterium]|jgi:glutamine synthetase|nr:hypothetical protein [Rickettsiales bacterium]
MDKLKNNVIFSFVEKILKYLGGKLMHSPSVAGESITAEDVGGYDFEERCRYGETPFIFFVKKNIDFLLVRADKKLSDVFKYKIGIESEFFSAAEFDNLSRACGAFCEKNCIKIVNVVRECAEKQYEIQWEPYDDIFLLVKHYEILKRFLIEDFGADFRAKPRYYGVGNALQINISLYDRDGKNIFRDMGIGRNRILQKSVNGLARFTNYFLPFYIKNENCLERYDKEQNKYIYSKGLIPAPSFNSCGINNRTASVRIPTPKNFRNKKKYEEEAENNGRIEFRVPSGASDIRLALYGVLTSAHIGLSRDLPDIVPTSNNLLENNAPYEKICIEDFSFSDIEYGEDFF